MNKDANVYSAMQKDAPYATYKKVILGKASVKVINPFSENPEEHILEGNPGKNDDGCFVDVWSVEGDMFFQKQNALLLKQGVLVKFDREQNPLVAEVNEYNIMDDEQLFELLEAPFFTLRAALEKMDSEAPVQRLLVIAEEEELSEKKIKHVKSRLQELQEISLQA
jgi:hypothetical protein